MELQSHLNFSHQRLQRGHGLIMRPESQILQPRAFTITISGHWGLLCGNIGNGSFSFYSFLGLHKSCFTINRSKSTEPWNKWKGPGWSSSACVSDWGKHWRVCLATNNLCQDNLAIFLNPPIRFTETYWAMQIVCLSLAAISYSYYIYLSLSSTDTDLSVLRTMLYHMSNEYSGKLKLLRC